MVSKKQDEEEEEAMLSLSVKVEHDDWTLLALDDFLARGKRRR